MQQFFLNSKSLLHDILVMVVCLLTLSCSTHSDPTTTEIAVGKTALPLVISITPEPTTTATLIPTRDFQDLKTLEPTQEESVEAFKLCSPLVLETIPELFEIVSDPYHPPPANRNEERHHGVDFSHYARKGMKSIEFETVQSVLPGSVAAVVDNRLPYGNMVIVESTYASISPDFAQTIDLNPDSSVYILYAHLEERPLVEIHDVIICGQSLGQVGKTGYNIVNPHLHLEIRIGPPGVVFDGMAFYTTTASQDEMDSYQRWRTSGEFLHIDPMRVFEEYLKWSMNNQ